MTATQVPQDLASFEYLTDDLNYFPPIYSILLLCQNFPRILWSLINFQIPLIQFYTQHIELSLISYNYEDGFQIQWVSISPY